MALASMIEDREPIDRRKSGLATRLLGLFCFAAVLVSWYFLAEMLVHWTTDNEIDAFVQRSRDSSDQIATNLARNLQDEVRRLANVPEFLADELVLRTLLTGPAMPPALIGDQRSPLQAANERLRDLARQLEIDIVYLVDATGNCLAASNFQSSDTVIGTDLHQRQYFSAIENGGRGRQFAFGTASGVPGVYFSSPIFRGGKFYGGVVVKKSMRSLFRLTNRNAAFLVDEYGVVVASTVEEALWHYLPDSAAAGLGSDFLQDRYHHEALSVIEMHSDDSASPVSLTYLLQETTPSLTTSRPIGDSGLRLVYFTPLPDLLAMRARAKVAFWLVFIAGALGLTLIAGAIVTILQTKNRVTALHGSYQKLSALSRELASEKATAQAADRAKSRFLATMSHELRTPFSGILGMVEILRASDLPEAARSHVGLLERSAQALLSLLNDILDFSKIDEGQLRVEHVSFDLQRILRDLGEIQRVVAAAKGISLMVEGADQPLVGIGDPNRLRQIFNNFLSNAIKFTALGGVRMIVSTTGGGAERRLAVRVVDSGPGVASEHKDQLFQPFFQADASTTRKHGGTGLGLAISKRIAEALGGQVGVDSEPGHGASFWLEVPFPETNQPPVNGDLPTPTPLKDALTEPVLSRRILLADDDEVNRLVIGGVLRRVGHVVSFAIDGREAVQMIAEQDFDLVVMDMHMPEMDGTDATRAVRTMQGAKARIPIIGLTADAIVENRQQYLSAGLDELLTKPIAAHDLMSVVRRFTEPPTG